MIANLYEEPLQWGPQEKTEPLSKGSWEYV